MSDLQNSLNEILRQKNAYLLPENIKKDVTVLGITGTLESGGSGSGDVKLFENKTELNTYLDDNYGDVIIGSKVVVYGELQSFVLAPNINTTSLYVPETITLSNVLTSTLSGYMYSIYNGRTSGGSFSITPSGFSIQLRMNSVNCSYSYESLDGQTYTRTTTPVSGGSFEWDSDNSTLNILGDNNYVYYTSGADVNILEEFFKSSKPVYDGIYSLRSVDDTYYRQFGVSVNTLRTEGLPSALDLCHLYYTPNNRSRFGINPVVITKQGKQVVEFEKQIYTNMGQPLIFKDGNIYRIGFVDYDSKTYRTDGSTTSYTKVVSTPNGSTDTRIEVAYSDLPYWDYGDSSYYNYFYELDTVTDLSDVYVIRGTSTGTNYKYLNYTESPSGGTYTNTTYNITSPTSTNFTNFIEPVIEKTQFTINNPNQLLTGVIGYGEDGTYIGDGSIYDNLDTMEIQNKILNLSSTNKYFSKPQVCISDIAVENKLQFFKNNGYNLSNDKYLCMLKNSESVTATAISSEYSTSNIVYNRTNNYIISMQNASNSRYKIIVEDKTTHTVVYNVDNPAYDDVDTSLYYWSVSGLSYTNINIYGNYYYFYVKYYNKTSTDRMYYFRLYRLNLLTGQIDTVKNISNAYNYDTSFNIINDKYMVWYYIYQYNKDSSKIYYYINSYIVDLFTGTTYDILTNSSFTTSVYTSDSITISISGTANNIYICYYLGYRGESGAKLYVFNKSNNTLSNMWTTNLDLVNSGDSHILDNVYEDNNYIYQYYCILPKSTALDGGTVYNLVDTDGHTISALRIWLGK